MHIRLGTRDWVLALVWP